MRDYFYSALEKYSLAGLQLIATIFMTTYFGVESIGMIGGFTLLVAISTVISEAGSSFVIMGGVGNISEKYSASLLLAFFLSTMFYIILFISAPAYTASFATELDYTQSLRLYGLIVFSAPLQLIAYSGLIKAGKTKILSKINVLAWIIAFMFLVVLYLVDLRHHEYVVGYFVILSLVRAGCGLFVSFTFIKYKLPKLGDIDLKYRLSIVISQIANTITVNIWTYMVAVLVSIEANAILGIFSKLRDLVSGNLSHAIHRIVYVNIADLSVAGKRKLIMTWLRRYALANVLFISTIYLLRNSVLIVFGVENINNSELLIIFPLMVGLLYPLTDLLKAILRYFKQSRVFQLELLMLVYVLFLYFTNWPLSVAFSAYCIGSLVIGLFIYKDVSSAISH